MSRYKYQFLNTINAEQLGPHEVKFVRKSK